MADLIWGRLFLFFPNGPCRFFFRLTFVCFQSCTVMMGVFTDKRWNIIGKFRNFVIKQRI
ncbi:hypothetical protein HMPREF6485_0719 [Segatella buccae ATCC 33574]|uniref:Uncharacterized protein n=1 Tax=Segatella buccae ATCC 33574 TaxID=873513 RepID=E6K580_9BACT|nr:hypothetical protein HMPREF6485_0719 [Segatella buccae ATCC 33574]